VLDRLRSGDPRAFEELVTSFQHRVFAVAYRMLGSRAEAEDAAQEVFLRIHKGIGAFRGDAALSTWIYAITSRVCLNRLGSVEGRLARDREGDDDTVLRVPSDHVGPAAAAERREIEQALHRAIAELPEDRRIVVVLRDLEGLSYEDIAAALELPLNTVRTRLHRARMDLKDKLEKAL
jgi:RNA polymerase sigma-70 factor (ECF subfamily)